MVKRVRYWLSQVLGISKAETNGILFLIPLILIIFITPSYYKITKAKQYRNEAEDSVLLNKIVLQMKQAKYVAPSASVVQLAVLKPFDPNDASLEELTSIGLASYLAKRIINYQDKGGTFVVKQDLNKIYGLNDSIYKSLSSFIQLPERVEKPVLKTKMEYYESKPKKSFTLFELNSADTLDFQQISGIGSVLSKRIVKYRNLLGGFTSTDQLHEVYGLKDEVIFQLEVHSYLDEEKNINQINLNEVKEYQLKSHPYISKKLAKAIISYRFQHGSFKSIEELNKIHLIDKALITKLQPYLNFAVNNE